MSLLSHLSNKNPNKPHSSGTKAHNCFEKDLPDSIMLT